MTDTSLGTLIVFLVICAVIWLIIRELICWYYKINKRVEQQDEMIRLLRNISSKLGADPTTTAPNNSVSPFAGTMTDAEKIKAAEALKKQGFWKEK